jgi:hypothetical protein
MFSGSTVVGFRETKLLALAWEISTIFWILSDWLRFPGYRGDSGENLGMSFRLNPADSEGVKQAKETAMRQRKREF